MPDAGRQAAFRRERASQPQASNHPTTKRSVSSSRLSVLAGREVVSPVQRAGVSMGACSDAQDLASPSRLGNGRGLDLARGVVENQPHRLLREVPVRKVAAAFEPVQSRIREEGKCPLRLIREAHLIVASPAYDERCPNAATWCAFLLFAIGEIMEQVVERRCLRVSAHFVKDYSGREGPRPPRELCQQHRACNFATRDGRHQRLQQTYGAN